MRTLVVKRLSLWSVQSEWLNFLIPLPRGGNLYNSVKLFFQEEKKNPSSRVTGYFPAGIYLFEANSSNTRKRFEIWLKLKIMRPERLY